VPHREEPESFAATGLDNAIDLLEVVTSKMDKASVGQQAAGLEQHPERRFKVRMLFTHSGRALTDPLAGFVRGVQGARAAEPEDRGRF
jgi:hypothetical protein